MGRLMKQMETAIQRGSRWGMNIYQDVLDMPKNLKEIFLNKANVDLETKKISNCEEGSFKWFHEEGHLKFQEEYSFSSMIKEFSYFLWLLSLTLSFFSRWFLNIGTLCMAYIIFHTIFEENWANKYAKTKTKHL